ncbi:mechanosensitive ion channel family protein [Acidihalobacter prosperus]
MSELHHWLVGLQNLIPGVALFLGGSLVIMLLQRWLKRILARLRHQTGLSVDTTLFFQRLGAASLWVILVLLSLRLMGVNVNGLWAILASTLAVVGVGLLAVWTMVSNITASLFIWVWRPYELGELIELLPDGLKGRAIDRSLMFTEIREEDGSTLMIPNNLFFQRIIRRAPNDKHKAAFERWESEEQ